MKTPLQLQNFNRWLHMSMFRFMFYFHLLLFRTSCLGGSPHPRTARMGRSPATRSDTEKGLEGVKRARSLEAPSFSSSSVVMAPDSTVTSWFTSCLYIDPSEQEIGLLLVVKYVWHTPVVYAYFQIYLWSVLSTLSPLKGLNYECCWIEQNES